MPALPSRPTLSKAVMHLLTATMCLTMCAAAASQNYFGSMDFQVRKAFNEKWTLRVDALMGHEDGALRSNVVACAAGVGYNVNKDVVIAIYNRTAFARYLHIDNRDTEISIAESVSWRRASGLFFGFYFEQRRLFYNPSDYAKNVSSCGGIVGLRKGIDRIGLTGSIACQVAANMKAPNTKSDVIQRIKLPISLKKSLTNSLSLAFSYTYAAMGDDDVFIADRDRLNSMSLTLSMSL